MGLIYQSKEEVKVPSVIWTIVKTYLASRLSLVAFRWLSPRQSQAGPECAVGELDLELGVETVNYAGAFTLILQKLDRRVNTDHPIFKYAGECAEKGESARITATISLRRTDPVESSTTE